MMSELEATLSPLMVWLFASGAVLAISLVGLLSILFIPLIQRDHQSDILQLLVGLAIGTLTSDALLHLLPHAFSSSQAHAGQDQHYTDSNQSHHEEEANLNHTHKHSSDHNHSESVWFGLMALSGIILFLTFERVVTIVSDIYNQSNKKSKVSNCNGSSNDKSCTRNNLKHNHSHNNSEVKDTAESEKLTNSDSLKTPCDHDHDHTSKPLTEEIEVDCLGGTKTTHVDPHEMQMTTEQCHRETIVYPHPDPDRGYVVELTDHHHHHQRQTHQGAKSVIYMVLTGDGLHNFCDGIAIGVAFVGGGLGGGISTTIAVLCHELPHEVGDFAVLLRAGLSVRKAITYNILSGLLCFFGMTLGVLVGKINDAWLSAGIAGMFLYIALVNMIPQLDCCPTQSGTTRAFKLTVQLIGISIGVAIMCIISLYESHIKLSFISTNSNGL